MNFTAFYNTSIYSVQIITKCFDFIIIAEQIFDIPGLPSDHSEMSSEKSPIIAPSPSFAEVSGASPISEVAEMILIKSFIAKLKRG